MATVHEAIEAAITEATTARSRVNRINTKQVRGVDDVATLKATAHTWFHTHRPVIASGAQHVELSAIDDSYTTLLGLTAKHAAKTTYLHLLKSTKKVLVAARAESLIVPAPTSINNTDDLAPDFSPLAGNQEMREILTKRWHECAKCVKADAHLAAIVMMGGLLEALFVARANKMTDKSPLTSARLAPKDKATGKTINYQDWMLDSYIRVGCELKWITESAKDIADKLKEYRNFVHPAKELR